MSYKKEKKMSYHRGIIRIESLQKCCLDAIGIGVIGAARVSDIHVRDILVRFPSSVIDKLIDAMTYESSIMFAPQYSIDYFRNRENILVIPSFVSSLTKRKRDLFFAFRTYFLEYPDKLNEHPFCQFYSIYCIGLSIKRQRCHEDLVVKECGFFSLEEMSAHLRSLTIDDLMDLRRLSWGKVWKNTIMIIVRNRGKGLNVLLLYIFIFTRMIGCVNVAGHEVIYIHRW